MRTLFIDIETFSAAPLPDVGVYKYAEDEDFDILLFGYGWDDDPIEVIDLTATPFPEELKFALFDDSIIKVAHNSSFERTCLSAYFGRQISPAAWHDTMVMASWCGLPLSLDAVGQALGLSESESKMKEGKALIRRFCQPRKPTKSNPSTRLRREDDPEQWQVFIEYNRRDVEVERTIYKRLLKWRPDYSEHKLWVLDQLINDRGMRVDLPLAENAVAIGEAYRNRLFDKAAEISGLDNPNSSEQIKRWLREQEGVTVTSLNKKVVADVVANLSDEKCREFMALRTEFSKSSTKKYEAIIRSSCSDEHIRGTFQFVGAGRTGRWCLTGDHEVLTPDGWVRLDEWSGGRIAVWNANGGIISFSKANALSFDYDGPMEGIDSARCSQLSTPDHCMPFFTRDGRLVRKTVHEKFGRRFSMPYTGRRTISTPLDNLGLRILIMVQADGHYTENGDLRVKFKRPRKIERCRELLRKADIPYVESAYESDCVTQFTIRRVDQPLYLRQFRDKTFGWWFLDENPTVILDEIEQWDGSRLSRNSVQYTTTNKQNADIIQSVAYLAGGYATMLVKHHYDVEAWSDAYVVNIWLTPGRSTEVRAEDQYVVPFYQGKVYCAETQTGYFIVRRNGRIWVTGNSGRLVQLQNLPQNHLEDLDSARQLVRAGDADTLELIYPDVQDTLSQLIRTALIPESGQKFIVADFAAIEARVIAWIAGEDWRQKVFAEGGDIYCMSASQMFHVPVVKHGVNGHLRQKGKIAELACIAKGQLVLTDVGLVPIEDVTTDMCVWDGESWVSHDGVVYRGTKEVISYDGLTATEDHLVWVEGKSWPIPFGDAVKSRARIIQTGNGREAIRLGGNHISSEVVEREDESLLGSDKVPWLRKRAVVGTRKSSERKKPWLPGLFSTETRADVAVQENDRGEAEVRESCKHYVSRVRGAWYSVLFRQRERGLSLHDVLRPDRQGEGDRPDRHQRKLRERKSALGNALRELLKSEKERLERVGSEVLALHKTGRPKEVVSWGDQGADNRRCEENCGQPRKELDNHRRTVEVYDIRNAGPNHRFTVSGKLVHNCGYGGGVNALKAFGADKLGMTDEEMAETVDKWRDASPHIVALWKSLEQAAIRCIRRKKSTLSTVGQIRFDYEEPVLWMVLPSGRRIAYWGADYSENRWGNASLSYMGTDQKTKKWARLETWGGKLTENLVQATARDCLKESLIRLSDAGYDVRGHVHDEVIITAPLTERVEDVSALMGADIPWAPGLLLRADGYECEYYRKD